MAIEAVLHIQDAEEKGGAIIKNAHEEARGIIKRAEAEGSLKRKAVIEEARSEGAAIMDAALKKADAECARLAAKAPGGRPGADRINKAVGLVVERIVYKKWQ